MSHNTLIEKIEHDAKQAIADIESKQAAQVAVIEGETQKLVAEQTAKADTELKKKLHHLELVTLAKAKQNSNIALQSAKRAHIDDIFATIAKSITALPAADYVSFFVALLKQVAPEKVEVTAVVTAASREAEAEKILHAVGIKADVQTQKGITAGVIVHTKDGVYDATLDRLISEKQAELEMEVVKALAV